MTRDRLITAHASKVSGAEFLNTVGPLFGFRPRIAAEKARDGELALAAIEHRQAQGQAPHGYWERRRFEDELRAAYAARIREIKARYAEQLVEVEHIAPGRIAA